MAIIAGECYLLGGIVGVPAELVDIWAEVEHFEAEARRVLLFHLLELFLLVAATRVLVVPLAIVVLPRLYGSKGVSLLVMRVDLAIVVHACTITRDAAGKVILVVVRCRLAALDLLLHFLPQHGFESSQDLLLVLLSEHVGELSHFPTLLRAADELLAHDGESDLVWLVWLEIDVACDDLVD